MPRNIMQHKPIFIIAAILSAFIVLLGYSVVNWNAQDIDYYLRVDDCQIDKTSCQVTLDKHSSIKVNILPRGIPDTKKLTVYIQETGDELDELSVSFEAIEIDTTTPQYRLYRQTENSFSGGAFLAICSLSKQSWVTHLFVKKGNETWEIAFPFSKQLKD
ncbi:hypothetical protein BHECKSOX2_899 [Bathymodiolus heckerae thiotrophic gill symbiont]|nr:hypothetical protein BHECKSOX2_899 [Bathymodiolus heckerae thiotrophic gill symbiont]